MSDEPIGEALKATPTPKKRGRPPKKTEPTVDDAMEASRDAPPTNELLASRAPRAEERVETGRRERIPLGTPRAKLNAPKRRGYTRRWVNDMPGRLADAQAAGYEFVRDDDRPNERGKSGGVCRRVGVNEDKTPLHAYLMEIPDEFYKQDQAAKQVPLDEFDAQLQRGIVRGADGRDGDNYYVPDEGITVKRDGPIVRTS